MDPHAELRERIAEFAAGRLTGPERTALERHLADCVDCADLVATWTDLAAGFRTAGTALLDPHPEAPALARWATSREARADDDAITRHVATCATCALEVEAARGPRSSVGLPGPAPRRLGTRIAGWAGAAAAAGVAVGLLLSGVVREPGAAPRWSGAVDLLSIDGPLRGEEGPRSLTVAPGQPYVPIALLPVLPADTAADAMLRMSIAADDGREVWSSTIQAGIVEAYLESPGVVTVLVPRDRLPDGRYVARVRVAGDPTRAPLLESPFIVRSR